MKSSDSTPLNVQISTPMPVPHAGTSASPMVYGEQWSFWVFFSVFVGGCIVGALARWLLADRDRASAFRTASWIGFVIGVAGAVGHSIFVDLRSDEKFIPVFDQTTLLWAAIAVGALLVTFVSEFSFGGASFKLFETKETAEDVIEKATDLVQNWTNQIAQFLADLEAGMSASTFRAELSQFLQLRAYEAVEWLSGDGEKRRLSLWIYDESKNALKIFFSNGITDKETLAAEVEYGKGVVGTVYKLQQTWNERDGPSLPVWIPIRSDAPRYHGIFLTPVNYSDLELGVLCVDRRKRERFSESAEDVMFALANVFAIAIGNQYSQELFQRGADVVASTAPQPAPNATEG